VKRQTTTLLISRLPNSCCRQKKKAVSCKKLSDIGQMWRDYEVIGIDEGQFFEDVSV
jgi:hypothetical protein